MQSKSTYFRHLTFFISIMMAFFALPAHAALSGYASLNSGGIPIVGDVSQAGREGTIAVRAYNQELSYSEKDKEQVVGPLVIMTEQGSHSPVLIQSFLNGEVISGIINFYVPDQSGAEVVSSTLEIEGGRVVGLEQELLNNLDPSQMQYPILDKITIEADSLTWTHLPSGNTATVTGSE